MKFRFSVYLIFFATVAHAEWMAPEAGQSRSGHWFDVIMAVFSLSLDPQCSSSAEDRTRIFGRCQFEDETGKKPCHDTWVGLKKSGGPERKSWVDASGDFSFSHLAKGSYFIQAHHDKLGLKSKEVEVKPGTRLEVTIRKRDQRAQPYLRKNN